MHMILRFFWLFLRRHFRPEAEVNEITKIDMRVLPVDLDFLWHVNNGVYFSFMDFGRMDMIFRNGVFKLGQKKGWYGVVASEAIKFRRSLKLWDKFTLETQIVGHDEKYFFISQKFICRGELMATGMVKIRFLKKSGGTVSVPEILKEIKNVPEIKAEELSSEWHQLESKYLT